MEEKPDGPEKAIASVLGGVIGVAAFFGLAQGTVEMWQAVAVIVIPALTSLAVWWKTNSKR